MIKTQGKIDIFKRFLNLPISHVCFKISARFVLSSLKFPSIFILLEKTTLQNNEDFPHFLFSFSVRLASNYQKGNTFYCRNDFFWVFRWNLKENTEKSVMFLN